MWSWSNATRVTVPSWPCNWPWILWPERLVETERRHSLR